MDRRGWGGMGGYGIKVGTIVARGEGYMEYVAILSLIMICSVSIFVSSFNNAFGNALRRTAGSKQLCAMQEDRSVQQAQDLGTETPVVEKQ
jgi:hypothetical protein